MSIFNAGSTSRLFTIKHKIFSILLLAALIQRGVFASRGDVLTMSKSSVMAPERLGNVVLCHDDDGFSVIKDDKSYPVKNYWVDKSIRNIDTQTLKAFLAKGYLALNQMSDGEYTINSKVRALGGGPITGAILYSLTKGTCYGVGVAALGTSVAAVGTGLAGAAVGAGVAAVASGAGTTSSIVAGAITAGGYSAVAAEVSTATVMAGGGLAGAAAAVEAASTTAYLIGLAIPWLP
jgi:hypothetical protein